MADIQGTCSEEFIRVREVLGKNLDSGADVGSSAAVFIDGEPVVDIWGGYLDEARAPGSATRLSIASRRRRR